MKNCPNKSCRFRDVCGNLPFICLFAQYAILIGIVTWVGYLFFSTR